MAERKATPIDLGDGDAGKGEAKPPPRPRRSPGRQSKLDRVEERLVETFDAIAMGQGMLAVMTADERHANGAEVTSQFGPKLAAAWCKLARENPRVEKVLVRMTEGSAWGEVAIATGGFVVAQAQAYEVVTWNPFVPPAGHPAGNPTDPRANGGTPVPPVPPVPPQDGGPVTGRQPPRSPEDAAQDPAQNVAEAQRRAVEERRRQRGS